MTNGANYQRGKLHHSPWHSDIRTPNQLNSFKGIVIDQWFGHCYALLIYWQPEGAEEKAAQSVPYSGNKCQLSNYDF